MRNFGLSLVMMGVIGCGVGGLSAATCTFTGATDGYWNKAANWKDGAIPQNGDDVILANTTVTTVNNNIQNLTIGNLTLSGWGTKGASGTAGGDNQFYLQGQKLTLTGDVTFTSKLRLNLGLNLCLAAGTHTFSMPSGINNARFDITGGGHDLG